MTVPSTIPAALKWQYQDANGDWQDFGPAQDLGAVKRTRRFGPGPRQDVTAQVWRLVKTGDTDWGTGAVALDAVRFWQETETLSAVRIWPFNFDEDLQRYFLVRTAGNIEVYHQDTRVASIAAPYTSDQVGLMTRAQVLDTLLSFHADVPPQRITRQGAHDQWDSRALAFDSLPLFDYNGDKAGGVNEVQRLRFDSYADHDTFNITLEGETTPNIEWTGGTAAIATAIKAALEGLGNVGAGNVDVTDMADNSFRVTFKGELAATDMGEMAPVTTHSAAGGVTCYTETQGKAGGEAIISATRGWPACGTFHKGRLFLGGLRSRPQTVLGSRVGQWFQFKGLGQLTAISTDFDTDETTTIRQLYSGQFLQAFTSSAEFYFPTEPIVPPAGGTRTTRRGVALGTPLAEIDGATLFVPVTRDAACEFLYDDTRQSYTADFLSKYASHLMKGIVDFGYRKARSPMETDRAVFIRDDGVGVPMLALRSDEVTGFTRWTTDGLFLAAAADLGGSEYVAVQRAFGGGEEIFLEKIDTAAMLDAEVRVAVDGDPVTQVSAPHLEGRTVVAYIDGADAGDVTVTDGIAVLPYPALRTACVGMLFQPHFVSVPGVLQQDPRGGASQGIRAGAIDFRLGPSANLKAGMAGGRMWTVPLKRRPDAVLDEGPGENAFEGWTRLMGIPGFRTDAQVEILQDRPGPLQIKEIVVTVTS